MIFFNVILKILVCLLPVSWTDRLLHSTLPHSERTLRLLYRLDPGILDLISRKKVMAVFRKASKMVPAYRDFLKQAKVDPGKIRTIRQFDQTVPEISKENYIHPYSISSRCLSGELPLRGAVEESSGSSGKSTYWIRSSGEENDYRVLTRTAMQQLYDLPKGEKVIVLNGFMTGGWTGNTKFGERIGSLWISRNTGPDPDKIIRCMQEFGSGITYLIGGYPPFLTRLIDLGNHRENFRWKDFRVHLYTSGEGFPEEWRLWVASELKPGALIYSGYGAIDLDVGVAAETPFTIVLRRLLLKDRSLSRELLKTSRIPCFIGQYPPHNYYIRESLGQEGKREPEISVLNFKSVSPMLKYVVGDEGGILPLKEVIALLEKSGHPVSGLMKEKGIKGIFPFPLIFIFGRSDGTVSVNGAMISPSEVNAAIFSVSELVSVVSSFKLSVVPDEKGHIRLNIFLEMKEGVVITESLAGQCSREITARMATTNECFRSSFLKNPETGSPVFKLVAYRTGIFEQKAEQVKENYLLP